MQVKINDEVLFEITKTDLDLLAHDLMDVEAEIRRRLDWVISHKVEQCYKRLKTEWDAKFAQDASVSSVPTKRDEYVALVVAHPEYKNRVERETNG